MSSLILDRIYYPVTTLGYGRRLGIWVRGCSRRCPGCLGYELQDGKGSPVETAEILAALPKDFRADGITVSGGEPFDQAEGLAELLEMLERITGDDVLVYTGYTIEELRERGDPSTEWILSHIAALIDGPYIASENDGRGIRGSSNQRIFVWKYEDRYRDAAAGKRQVQFVEERTSLFQIGVPPTSGAGHDKTYG